MREREPSSSESYFWPTFWAVVLHIVIFGALFISFAFTPELPPSKPVVQATLYELKSKSPATTQTNRKIAGESSRTAARQTEIDQLEQKKAEQQAVAEAEQKKADAAQKAEQARQADEAKKEAAADAAKAAEAKKAADAKASADAAKALEAQKAEQATIAAKKKAEDDAKKQAEEDAKKKAAEDAKKQAAEDAKKKAAEDAKKQAADDAKKKAAEDAKKQASADAAKKKAQDAARKAQEDKKAQALADLLSDKTEREATKADETGDSVSGNFDDLIRTRASENWNRPPSARKGMVVRIRINMLPDGTVTNATIDKSSGDSPFDASALAAVKNIGRLPEMQGLSPQDFAPYRNFLVTFTPEDLAL